MTARKALDNIRRYERLVNIPADFASPYRNPGRVVEWVQIVNHATGINERPIELDDDPRGLLAEDRRQTILAARKANIEANRIWEAGR